jgi:hypothetical protein
LSGRTVRGPLTIVKHAWGSAKVSEDLNYVLETRKRLRHMQEIVYENLKGMQEKQKKLYDRQSSRRLFGVGDKVLVLLSTPGSKLEMKWQGPFIVTKVFENGLNYEVDRGKGDKQKRVYHINLLKLWKTREELATFSCSGPISPEKQEGCNPWGNQKETWQDVEISPELSTEQVGAVQNLLQEYSDIFSNTPSRTCVAEHKIDTGEAAPIRSPPYRIPQSLTRTVHDELRQMLVMGIVRPSKSPWAAPVVIVPKPDGTIRFCVDYRKFYNVAKMDAYPIPRMDQMLEKVAQARYISTLDITKGYWQIPLNENSIPKSAFITSQGLFEFTVMPFGMKTAPATFQRMMKHKVLNGLESFADAYIDDVEIDTSTTFEQHLNHLRQVFDRLRQARLSAKPSKCRIAMSVVDFIGHRVGGGTITPREALIETILQFPRPQTKKQVRSFLGLAGYYRRFIRNFADIAAPLTDLTKKPEPTRVVWTNRAQNAFSQLKQKLTSPPVLRPPCWDRGFILKTDASGYGMGAILSQLDENNEEHPIAFASRKLQPRELKLATVEKECLAIVWAVETFRYYLFGRKFKLQTDHNPLVWLNQVKNKNRKLLRWSLTLQEYEIEYEHKAGENNVDADALSRIE